MSRKGFITVVNFEKYQHYKDRNPPWIKLYYSLLSNYEFCSLSDQAKYHLIGIFMLAGRTNNRIPNDLKWIISELKCQGNIDLNELKRLKFITFTASKPLEKMEHFEKDSYSSSSCSNINIINMQKFDEFWKAYPRKNKPNKQGTLRAWSTILKNQESDPGQLIQCAKNYAVHCSDKEDAFILHPATFLGKDRRYKDYIESPDNSGQTKKEYYQPPDEDLELLRRMEED